MSELMDKHQDAKDQDAGKLCDHQAVSSRVSATSRVASSRPH
jgi:hypothetical protein